MLECDTSLFAFPELRTKADTTGPSRTGRWCGRRAERFRAQDPGRTAAVPPVTPGAGAAHRPRLGLAAAPAPAPPLADTGRRARAQAARPRRGTTLPRAGPTGRRPLPGPALPPAGVTRPGTPAGKSPLGVRGAEGTKALAPRNARRHPSGRGHRPRGERRRLPAPPGLSPPALTGHGGRGAARPARGLRPFLPGLAAGPGRGGASGARGRCWRGRAGKRRGRGCSRPAPCGSRRWGSAERAARSWQLGNS